MPAPDQIRQGNTYYLIDDVTSEFESAIYTLEVKRFPDDEPAIEKEGSAIKNKIEFVLTPEETAALDIGLWYLITTITLADWVIEKTKRVQITKGWT